MKHIIVTSGQAYTDIDALACAIAYTELLNFEGKEADAVLPGQLNHSVTPIIKSWGLKFLTIPPTVKFDSVLVDTSHLGNFASFVVDDSIVEIYDHHYGAEEYWQEKLRENCHIEMVGACATLIWEEFKKRGYSEKISTTSANLLFTAIISNTLNFGAQITKERDLNAFNELQQYINLPENWIAMYFKEQEIVVYENIIQSVIGDTKVVKVPTLSFPIVIGQIELWDSKQCLIDHKIQIKETLEGFQYPHWIMSLPSIKEKYNYLYTENPEVRKIFSDIIGAIWEGPIGVTKKLWLRKEIRKQLYEYKRDLGRSEHKF